MSQCLIKKIEDPTLQTDSVQQIIERLCFILPQIKRKYSTKQQWIESWMKQVITPPWKGHVLSH